MSLKKLGIAVMAMMILGAASASNAFAVDEFSTDVASWTAGGVNLAQNTPEGIKCKKTAASANFTLTTVVAEAPFELEASGVSCSEATVTNITVGGVHMAVATGKITFTGVKVKLPAGTKCVVPEEMVKTNLLEAILQMGKGANPTSEGFVEFKPDAAAGQTNFASVKIEGCSLEGSYKVTGIAVGKATKATNEDEIVQEVNGDTTTDAISSLKFGLQAATLHGEIAVELNSGKSWGATNN